MYILMYIRNMNEAQLVSVSEMRVGLPKLIKEAAGGKRIEVGAHRKAEAVLIGLDELSLIPDRWFLEKIVHMVARCTAHDEFCGGLEHQDSGVWHPGDLFGRVLAWLWKAGQRDMAVELVSDLVAEARYHNPHRPEARPSFKSLLSGIPLATGGPGWGVDAEASEEMIKYLRDRVTRLFSDDIDAP